MTWPLYSTGIVNGIVASSVVWVSTIQFLLVGLKIVHDPHFASSMGAPPGQEHLLLQGPVQYGITVASLTVFSFKSPLSIIPIGVLCGGDAIAALVGSRFGRHRIPWNQSKVRCQNVFVLCLLAFIARFCNFRMHPADCGGNRCIRRWSIRCNIGAAKLHEYI